MAEADVAWAAGFVDGEGCITIRTRIRSRNRRDYSLSLYVGQVDPSPLFLLSGMFGGNVVRRKAGRSGRQMFMWRVTGAKAGDALRAMVRFFRVKGDQAVLALQFLDLVAEYKQVGRRVSDEETTRRMDIITRITAAKWRTFEEGGDAQHGR